jgi:hypothetical protein
MNPLSEDRKASAFRRLTERKAIMQFLAISRMRTDLFSDADFAPLLEDEAQRAHTLYIEGAVRQIWHRGDGVAFFTSTCPAGTSGMSRVTISSLPGSPT